MHNPNPSPEAQAEIAFHAVDEGLPENALRWMNHISTDKLIAVCIENHIPIGSTGTRRQQAIHAIKEYLRSKDDSRNHLSGS